MARLTTTASDLILPERVRRGVCRFDSGFPYNPFSLIELRGNIDTNRSDS
jgi:hypothetical protein